MVSCALYTRRNQQQAPHLQNKLNLPTAKSQEKIGDLEGTPTTAQCLHGRQQQRQQRNDLGHLKDQLPAPAAPSAVIFKLCTSFVQKICNASTEESTADETALSGRHPTNPTHKTKSMVRNSITEN